MDAPAQTVKPSPSIRVQEIQGSRDMEQLSRVVPEDGLFLRLGQEAVVDDGIQLVWEERGRFRKWVLTAPHDSPLTAFLDNLRQALFPGVGGGEASRLEQQTGRLHARGIGPKEAPPVLIHAVEPVRHPADAGADVADPEPRETLQDVVAHER